jgi:hypothetical protein
MANPADLIVLYKRIFLQGLNPPNPVLHAAKPTRRGLKNVFTTHKTKKPGDFLLSRVFEAQYHASLRSACR